jgi:hypothetical protein
MRLENALPEATVVDPISFTATDVTGTNVLEFSAVDGYRNAGDIAMSVAEAMELPLNTPWALRDDEHARMLEEASPLGSQVNPGAKLVVIPKSHLGTN